ncbi:ABC transporter ATP-binding protein [Paenibacillus macerans]|uniref:ABC transporter ATP-binding protein n=1 Tax=Paenibacillus macerans TaxID=44252 RepID=UPI0020403A88|nr:ABC transporter ATP-binding protein [Paenibacillus macerans]MCM3700707.1 ABC transporter ATP-binding protein [Paenibacillus macerans]
MTLEIHNLNKDYGQKQALQNISLTIGQGMFGLLGRNGAGKTTLMKTLATLLRKKSGDVTVCGIPLENAKEIRRIIGYLPQDFSMYGNMGVYEAMDYLGVLSGLSRETRKRRIPLLLERVNLINIRHTKVRALSGGMKRRLGIAQAILHEPKVLIVDEPTAGLDPEERIRFRNLLSELAGERIVLLSTHIIGDIEAACEEIAVLEAGKLLYRGTVRALANSAAGKVFNAVISRPELERLRETFVITGMSTFGGQASVRLLADRKPTANAVPCEPDLEDGYMLLMQDHGVRTALGGTAYVQEGM